MVCPHSQERDKGAQIMTREWVSGHFILARQTFVLLQVVLSEVFRNSAAVRCLDAPRVIEHVDLLHGPLLTCRISIGLHGDVAAVQPLIASEP